MAPNSSAGRFVKMRTAPPIESRPNIVPCGPRKTSTTVEIDELLGQQAGGADLPDAVDVGADVRDAAHAEARCRPVPPAPPMTLTFGIVAFRFSTFWRPRISRPSPVIATMEMGTSWRFCSRRVAVTTISSSAFLGEGTGLDRQTTDARQCCHDCCVDFGYFHETPPNLMDGRRTRVTNNSEISVPCLIRSGMHLSVLQAVLLVRAGLVQDSLRTPLVRSEIVVLGSHKCSNCVLP